MPLYSPSYMIRNTLPLLASKEYVGRRQSMMSGFNRNGHSQYLIVSYEFRIEKVYTHDQQ